MRTWRLSLWRDEFARGAKQIMTAVSRRFTYRRPRSCLWVFSPTRPNCCVPGNFESFSSLFRKRWLFFWPRRKMTPQKRVSCLHEVTPRDQMNTGKNYVSNTHNKSQNKVLDNFHFWRDRLVSSMNGFTGRHQEHPARANAILNSTEKVKCNHKPWIWKKMRPCRADWGRFWSYPGWCGRDSMGRLCPWKDQESQLPVGYLANV